MPIFLLFVHVGHIHRIRSQPALDLENTSPRPLGYYFSREVFVSQDMRPKYPHLGHITIYR